MPPVEWDVAPERICFHLGRASDVELQTVPEQNWERPLEDEEDGCPGGDQRSRMLLSLMRFYRRRDQQGNRISNPAFDRNANPLVEQAIMYFESQQEASDGERSRQHLEELRRKDR